MESKPGSGYEDRDLIDEVLHGDEKACRKLVEGYNEVVFAVVRGILGNNPDVEDTVQEVFIKIFRNLHSFRKESRLSTWIYRIARNEALNASNRATRRMRPADDVSLLPSGERSPDEEYERDRSGRQLERMLGRLDEHFRLTLELRYMGDKSYQEIADIMDIPIGTVKTYIYRAKAELKKMIDREDGWTEKNGRPV